MAPFLGPLLKEASWRVESGMATQRAAPPTGTAKREMSKTASEGHFLSAASFVASIRSICATKATRVPTGHRHTGKPLQIMYLPRIEGDVQGNYRRVRPTMKCRILHIRCTTPGVGGKPRRRTSSVGTLAWGLDSGAPDLMAIAERQRKRTFEG